MKRNILKKSIIVALLATFCAAPFAPTSQKVMAAGETIEKPTYYEVPNDFRLVAYGTPPTVDVKEEDGVGDWVGFHDYNNVTNWQTMKDCGFEFTQAIYYEDADEDYIRSLENADAVNAANPTAEPIKVLISNYDFMNPNSLAAITREGGTYAEAMAKIREREDAIKARYDVFKTYDSFAGIFGADEPSAHMFEAIAAAQDWFEWNYPEYEFYINLFPEYASDTQLFGKKEGTAGYSYGDTYTERQAAYKKYISEFCDTVTPYIVSYDHYCLTSDGTIPGYFYNLAEGATQAKRVEEDIDIEVPFYVYLQSMGFEGKMKIDKYERWAWQCYTSMAFGVTGIQAFCYWTLLAEEDANGDIIEDAIVDRVGKKTALYDIVQRTNADIEALEQTYMAYNWEGTKGWSGGSATEPMTQLHASGLETAGYADIAAVSVETSREFLIGQFADRSNSSKKAYMITNSTLVHSDVYLSYYPTANIDVTFEGVSQVDVYKPGNNGVAERITLNNGVLSMTVPLGEGYFVVPVTE